MQSLRVNALVLGKKLFQLCPKQSTRSTSEFERIFSMDPSEGLTDDQKEIFNMASKFAKEKMKPHMAEWDRNETFPIDVMREAASLGFLFMN